MLDVVDLWETTPDDQAILTTYASLAAAVGVLAQDVYDLVRSVKKRVEETLGIELEPEVRFVGEFRDGEEPL